jgi:hypothetical protein
VRPKKIYYLVHENNLDDVKALGVPEKDIQHWRKCCNRNYIYLSFYGDSVDGTYPYENQRGIMKYNRVSREWFKKNRWKYMGEFSLKIVRKEKLKKIGL